MRLAPKLLNCRVNMTFLLKTTRFSLAILKRVKNRYNGNIMFVAIGKLVAHTLLCKVKSVVNNNRYLSVCLNDHLCAYCLSIIQGCQTIT